MTQDVGYLGRRIRFLIDQLQQGNVHFVESFALSESGQQLFDDLERVREKPNGLIDLSTCSPLVKTIAKALYAMPLSEPNTPQDSPAVSAGQVSEAMRRYFAMLADFFLDATGEPASEFSQIGYKAKIMKDPPYWANRFGHAMETHLPRINRFHGQNSHLLLGSRSTIGGLKYVLGGSSRFPDAALGGVRKAALYADTIYIPDPLLPWIEIDRAEERFRHMELLSACQTLLQLRPLVDAQLSYPAVIVFPSWEKSLETNDAVTQDGIAKLTLGFFSHYLNGRFEDESEVIHYVSTSGKDAFLEAVTRHELFWPAGADRALPFQEALQAYVDNLRETKSKEWLARMESLPPELNALTGITERLIPQFHAQDNSATLGAQPMFWLTPHFHYFKLLSQAGNSQLETNGLLKPATQLAVQSLLQPKNAWLGNVPMKALARLREEGCNESFRGRMLLYAQELSEASLEDIDAVAAAVLRGIQSLLDEHDREAKSIAEKFEWSLLKTLGTTVLTIGGIMFPGLDPYFGLAALGPVTMFGGNVLQYAHDRHALSHSLIGVLSTAKTKVPD